MSVRACALCERARARTLACSPRLYFALSCSCSARWRGSALPCTASGTQRTVSSSAPPRCLGLPLPPTPYAACPLPLPLWLPAFHPPPPAHPVLLPRSLSAALPYARAPPEHTAEPRVCAAAPARNIVIWWLPIIFEAVRAAHGRSRLGRSYLARSHLHPIPLSPDAAPCRASARAPRPHAPPMDNRRRRKPAAQRAASQSPPLWACS